MVSLLLALCLLAAGLGYWVVVHGLEARRRHWQALAERFGLAFDEARFELSGAVSGLPLRVHDGLDVHRAAQMGAVLPLGGTSVAVDVEVEGLPAGLRARSAPALLAPRRFGGPTELEAPREQFERAYLVEAADGADRGLLEDVEVREALMAIAATKWHRGVILEERRLTVFHFNPALATPGDDAELERTVCMALEAAVALCEACAARVRAGRKAA